MELRVADEADVAAGAVARDLVGTGCRQRRVRLSRRRAGRQHKRVLEREFGEEIGVRSREVKRDGVRLVVRGDPTREIAA